MLNKNRLYELSKDQLEKENLIKSIQSYKINFMISFITLIISISSLSVSCSSQEMSKMMYEYSLNEELDLDEIGFTDKPTYIKFFINKNNEYIISNELYIRITNKSHHSSSISSLQRIEVYNKEKYFKTIIKNMDGEILSDDNGNLRKSINLKADENINLKIVVNHPIKSKDIQELIVKNNLINKDISKNNIDSIINKITTTIYGNERPFVSVNTSKYHGVIIGWIDLYN